MLSAPKSINRLLAEKLARALQHSRVVALVGARQAGKTTLVKTLDHGRSYVSLDALPTRRTAEADPVAFIGEMQGPVAIDEIQLVPDLLPPIKMAVDSDPTYGRFLLTGSADILTLPKIADSLAGRMQVYELFPLAEAEIEQLEPSTNAIDRMFSSTPDWQPAPIDFADVVARIVRGGYPEILRLPEETDRANWFDGYIQTMLRRDIVDVAKIENAAAMHRLLSIVGARTGRVLNVTSLANDIQMPPRTAQRYLEILEQTFLIYSLPAWTSNRGRRYIRSPKIFINDTGLGAALANIDASLFLRDRTQLSPFMESFVVTELRKQASWAATKTQLFHYRTYGGQEIDLVLETRRGERVAIEIKASATFSKDTIIAFNQLIEDLQFDRGFLLYMGDSVLPIGKNATAVPIPNLWIAP